MIWPTAADERAAALRELHLPAEERWRHNSLIVSIVFFCLTLFGVGAFAGLMRLIMVPNILSGLAVIAIAEVLIAKKKFFGTGVESALWISGVFFFIFALPHTGQQEALLVVATGFALAGARLLHPFFGTLAAICVVAYPGAKNSSTDTMAIIAVAIAIVAAVAQRVEWQRRSTERLFQLLAIVVPPAGAIAAEFWTIHRAHLAIAYAVGALAIFSLGIAFRARALLIAGALCAVVASYEASHLNHATLEAKLIAGGALMLVIAIALSRALRGRTRGFVIAPSSLTGYDEAMQIAGAIHVTPPAPAPAPAATGGYESGGGGFGGGGASAGY
jgi:hypothetical protein